MLHALRGLRAICARDVGIGPSEVIELGLQSEVGYALSNSDIDEDEALAIIAAAR